MGREHAEHMDAITEPPRDGEFFLDEESGIDERLVGAVERGTAGLARFPLRFPWLSLGLAVVFGVIVSAAIYELLV